MASKDILRAIDILKSYSNEFWKYPVIAYYLTHHKREDFAQVFYAFLKRLIAFLLLRYLQMPTISAVKGDVLKLDAAIIESERPAFPREEINRETLRPNILEPHSKIIRMLLKILAYDKQEELLPKSWDIEHVLPHKWENGYFPKEDEASVRRKVEMLGNKAPLETIKNIRASNGFFAKKKEQYKTSAIQVVKDLCAYNQWTLSEIEDRNAHVVDTLIDTLKTWIAEYEVGK